MMGFVQLALALALALVVGHLALRASECAKCAKPMREPYSALAPYPGPQIKVRPSIWFPPLATQGPDRPPYVGVRGRDFWLSDAAAAGQNSPSVSPSRDWRDRVEDWAPVDASEYYASPVGPHVIFAT